MSHLETHRALSSPDGSYEKPFFDLRDALSFVEDTLGTYQEAEATVYLTVGEHFLPFRTSEPLYSHTVTNNNDEELTFNLILK